MNNFLSFSRFLGSSLNKHRYLYAVLPLICVLLFVLTIEQPRTGEIKTANFTYTGTIYADKPNGKGTLVFTNKDSYTGSFKDGKFDGQGTFTSKTGKWSYTGSFKAGQMQGTGTLKTPDGKARAVKFNNGVVVE